MTRQLHMRVGSLGRLYPAVAEGDWAISNTERARGDRRVALPASLAELDPATLLELWYAGLIDTRGDTARDLRAADSWDDTG